MIKDLSAKLVAAVTEINQKSRQSFAAEQQEVATKKAASAKMHTFMPKQPAPKADPAAVTQAHKMAEEAGGTTPKTPKEKELAAKSGNPNKITQGDVLKARGVKVEGFMSTMKKIGNKVLDAVAPSDEQLLKNLDKSIHGKKAAAPAAPVKPKQKMAHDYVKEDKEKGEKKETAAKEKAEVPAVVPEWKKKMNDPWAKEKSAFHSKQISTGTVYSRKYEEAGQHNEEVETLDELSKSTLGSYVKKATRNAIITRKIGADFEHQGNRAKSPGMKAASNEMSQKYKEKSWKRRDGVDKAVDRLTKEEVESVAVKHDQYGAGKTLPQFAEDLSWIDVMFDEGIKRVNVEDLELTEEKAVHPDAIHVSNAGGGKYKVHAVGSNFSHGIKVGEHLTDTHLDDFSEMGGKIRHVKAPKKD